MTPLLFLAAVLATYRLSLLVSKEDGPYWIFSKIRRLPPAKSSTREGLSCPLCTSVYASALVASFFVWLGYAPVHEWPLWWLSASGGAVLLHLLDGK